MHNHTDDASHLQITGEMFYEALIGEYPDECSWLGLSEDMRWHYRDAAQRLDQQIKKDALQITLDQLQRYNEYMHRILTGAPEDAIQEFCDNLATNAEALGFKLVYDASANSWFLKPMTDEEKAEFAKTLEQEELARQAEYALRQSQVTASEFSSYEAFKDWEEHHR